VRVRVEAGSRLHLGFLDLQGGLGRRFGSLGVALDRPGTVLEAERAEGWDYEGPEPFRRKAEAVARAVLGDLPPVRVRLSEAPPPHAGFGSGTQVALATGLALARLGGRKEDPRRLAGLVGRGRRSGVGVEAFAGGGFLVDGGLRPGAAGPPPLLFRRPLPEPWRFLVAVPGGGGGLHGTEEERAIAALPLPDPSLAERLCRWVLMALLPALAEGDGPAFGAALTAIQRLVGESFAPALGGIYASPGGERLAAEMERRGALGVGQSSWGPAVFGFFDDPGAAERVRRELADGRGTSVSPAELFLAGGMNRGARVRMLRGPRGEEG
jgi:beta-RFAP synthase